MITVEDIALVPYSYGSESAQRLKGYFRGYGVSVYNKPNKVVINWGSSQKFSGICKIYVNHPLHVYFAVDKRLTFKILDGKVPIPKWSVHKDEATTFNRPVYTRTKVRGTQGDGIILDFDEVSDGLLYVEGINTLREYRVVVVGNKTVATMQKTARANVKSKYIWNLENGYKFTYENTHTKEQKEVEKIAVEAVKALNLDFGAVDILVDNELKKYVLEVNTAFGLGQENLKKVGTELYEYLICKQKELEEKTRINNFKFSFRLQSKNSTRRGK